MDATVPTNATTLVQNVPEEPEGSAELSSASTIADGAGSTVSPFTDAHWMFDNVKHPVGEANDLERL